jgi:hypothetical protein
MTDNIDFGRHPDNRTLRQLASMRPEWHYTVEHATRVPITFEADAYAIDPTDPPTTAFVWWLRLESTGKPSLFRYNGQFGSRYVDPHCLIADEASIAMTVAYCQSILDGSVEDEELDDPEPRQLIHSIIQLPRQSHDALVARVRLSELGRDDGPLALHRHAPSSHMVDARSRSQYAQSDDEIISWGDDDYQAHLIRDMYPETADYIAHIASRARVKDVRREWRSKSIFHPHDPATPLALVHQMNQGVWLGPMLDYIPGVGFLVPLEALQVTTGLMDHEIESTLRDAFESGELLRLQDVDFMVVADNWRPQTGFSRFCTIDDIVNVFEPRYHELVRTRVVDAWIEEQQKDLAAVLDSLDTGINFSGEAPTEGLGLGGL